MNASIAAEVPNVEQQLNEVFSVMGRS